MSLPKFPYKVWGIFSWRAAYKRGASPSSLLLVPGLQAVLFLLYLRALVCNFLCLRQHHEPLFSILHNLGFIHFRVLSPVRGQTLHGGVLMNMLLETRNRAIFSHHSLILCKNSTQLWYMKLVNLFENLLFQPLPFLTASSYQNSQSYNLVTLHKQNSPWKNHHRVNPAPPPFISHTTTSTQIFIVFLL